jgi:pyruvate dehydrogenase E2 component (dihydrolipoyllysine-residue acetyltransferase)
MATEIKLPQLGESVDSGVVSKVLISAGDSVTEDQPVIELDTEKATVEVPTPVSGTVKEVRVKEGETIKVGQVILTVEEGSAAAEGKKKTEGTAKLKEGQQKPEPTSRPREAEKKTKPEFKGEEKPEEEKQKDAEAMQEPEKVAEAKPHPTEEEQEKDKSAAPMPREKKAETAKAEELAPKTPKSAPEPVPAAPSVRRMARELGIDITEVSGSGPGGRISEEDIRNYARSIILNVTRPQPALPAVSPPDFTQWGEVERKAMTSVRRKTAEHTRDAWLTIPHVTQFDEADITELEELRERYGGKAEAAGGKLTITAIALKVAAAALKVFPQFNSSLDTEAEEIIYKKYCHIGVAVDTERGLLVPVIRDVDKKDLLELSVELTQLAEKARQKKLTLEEMQGGTFTITNLGGIGGFGFTPIINSPEVAILGIARAANRPFFVDGQFQTRLMLPLALSYDHRLIDGADAARFLRWVAEALHQPFLLALEA